MSRPHFVLDTTHLLIGWRVDGWRGVWFQWEFGAYVQAGVAWSERHDYRALYNYPSWRRIGGRLMRPDGRPLPRVRVGRL